MFDLRSRVRARQELCTVTRSEPAVQTPAGCQMAPHAKDSEYKPVHAQSQQHGLPKTNKSSEFYALRPRLFHARIRSRVAEESK